MAELARSWLRASREGERRPIDAVLRSITHYGGKQDGMNPSDPSFGTKEVSDSGSA